MNKNNSYCAFVQAITLLPAIYSTKSITKATKALKARVSTFYYLFCIYVNSQYTMTHNITVFYDVKQLYSTSLLQSPQWQQFQTLILLY